MYLIFAAMLGAVVGSFLGVVSYRLPKRESIVFPPSHCASCRHKLAFFDLIPILSFILLSGKCRYCKKSISYYDFYIEIITALIFAANFYFFSNFGIVVLTMMVLISCVFIVVFFSDLRSGLIPFQVVLVGVIFTIVYLLLNTNLQGLFIHLLSAFAAFLSFLFLFLVTKGKGMGFGDVILVFLMGLFLGFPQIGYALYIAFLTGAGVSLMLILIGRKHLRNDTIPFGPFLVIGTFVTLYFSDYIQNLVSIFLPV